MEYKEGSMKCDYCGEDKTMKQILVVEITIDEQYYRIDLCKWCAEETPILKLIY